MPDTPELQKAFGQPPGQKVGCGFPVANLLVLFDLGTGFLMRIGAAPLRSHEMSRAATFHAEMQPNDVLVADRGFCSYAHLALLFQAEIHGVFRIHQQLIVNFRKGRPHASTGSLNNRRRSKGRPRSPWIQWLGHVDQIVEYVKPWHRPLWMTAEEYAALPVSLRVRELRYRIEQRGYRTRDVLLVTTLLDHTRYPSEDLAELYGQRWLVETNLRHLKQTLGMDVLRTKSLNNILKELAMYAIVYNLVRLVMLKAAQQQGTDLQRISFVDALRWLRTPPSKAMVSPLLCVPLRKGRVEPRVQKRRVKQYSLMTQPRNTLRRQLPLPGYA